MYIDVNGTLVPAPGGLALLGLAGLAGRRRRR
jgi:MYXO-CTERM domain-containing protein